MVLTLDCSDCRVHTALPISPPKLRRVPGTPSRENYCLYCTALEPYVVQLKTHAAYPKVWTGRSDTPKRYQDAQL